ncbi:NYN domain-containing protein, partial [Patescibacteria group bacterium]|nr:NYN domain-containing protein [Patescibacteria group bacterium]
ADWDVGITVDAIRLSPSLDTIILVSGDGDYLPLVEYLQNQGKQVEVVAFGETTSSRLKEEADDFIDMGEEKGKFLINDRRIAYPSSVQKRIIPKVQAPVKRP